MVVVNPDPQTQVPDLSCRRQRIRIAAQMTDQISRLFRSLPGAIAPPLRIGVLLDGFELPRVFRGPLEDIRASDFAQLAVLIFNDEQPEPPSAPGGVARYVGTLADPRRRRHALFFAYEASCTSPFASRIAGSESRPCSTSQASTARRSSTRGRWWMFTTSEIGRHHAAVTLLFSAEDLRGPWRQHPQSPISTDVRVARSAGPVIRDSSRLLRVSQNCAGGYGRNLVFSEIQELAPARYRERRLTEVFAPRPGDTGMHTVGSVGGKPSIPRT